MATYSYSAGYQGGGPQAVPSGYIEAYSQAGRNIGAGMQQIGNAIGESLARYGQNKAENEFLQTRLESLAPYLNTVAQSGNIMDKNSAESKLLGDIEKFSSMSIPQKKATLLNAEFFLDRADKAKAREMQDLQTTQLRNQISANEQLGALMQYGMTKPTTQTVTEPTTDGHCHDIEPQQQQQDHLQQKCAVLANLQPRARRPNQQCRINYGECEQEN